MQQHTRLGRGTRRAAAVIAAGLVVSALATTTAHAAITLPDPVVVSHGAAGVADAYNGVVAAPDGGTYQVGYQVVPVGANTTNRAILVTKSNADGSLDTSFGTGGRALVDLVTTFNAAVSSNPGAKEVGKGIAVDKLGRLLVLGEVEGDQSAAGSAVDTDIFVARLHPNGALDRSYGTETGGGWTRINFGDGVNPSGATAIPDTAGWDIMVRPNQKSIAAVGIGTDSGRTTAARDAAAVQLTANGKLDASYGENGVATIATPFGENLRRGLLEEDGSFFTTSYANVGSNNQPFINKFTPTGQPDETWGDDGLATTYPGGLGGFAEAYGMTKDADGNYLVSAYGYRGGRTGAAAGNSVDALLFSLKPDGSLNSAWGDRGMVAYHIGADGNNSGDRHRDHVVLPDGRIVGIGGTSGTSDALVTLTNPDGTPGDTKVIDFGGTDDYLWGIRTIGDGYQVVAVGYGSQISSGSPAVITTPTDAQLVLLDLSPTASTTAVTVAKASAPYGTANTATITLAVDGAAAAGSVKVALDGKALSTVAVGASGTATVNLPKSLAVGNHTLTATRAVEPGIAASQATATLKVTKAASSTTVKLSKTKIKKSKKATATVTVKGAKAGEAVTVFAGSKKVGTAKVNASGVATVSLGKLKVGKHQIRATYAGSANVAGSAGTATLRVVK